jgi:Mrp family chromosome partitioning ATPase
LAVLENIKLLNLANFSAVLITTPQNIAVNDVRREITFCKKTEIPIAGIIENMSGFTCPNCKVSKRIMGINNSFLNFGYFF